MKLSKARRWIGVYFLVITATTGLFLLLFSGSVLLPISEEQASSCFQVIIPVFVGQLAVIFQWIAKEDAQKDKKSSIPVWAILLPPCLSAMIIVVAAVILAIGNLESINWKLSPKSFQNAITFAVSIVNATTVLLMPRLFPSSEKN